MSKRVYLAGSISGLSYKEAVDWRQLACEKLLSWGITGFSPMRAKEFLEKETEIHSWYESPLGQPHGFVARDRFDIQGCDLILMNLLNAKQVSIGSMVELGWADAYRKPVVLVWEGVRDSIHAHGFVEELTAYKVSDLERGLELVRAILL